MGSEVINYGRINVYLGAVDADPPAQPDVTPLTTVWTEIGASYLTDDALTLSSSQELQFEHILNETLPVEVYRLNEDLMMGFSLKDLTMEVVNKAFNNNAITDTAAAVGTVGYRTMRLDRGLQVAKHALLVVYHSSPYDSPNVQTDAFVSNFYLPRCAEVGDFESVLGAKQAAMVPLSFQALKSDTATKHPEARMVDAPAT